MPIRRLEGVGPDGRSAYVLPPGASSTVAVVLDFEAPVAFRDLSSSRRITRSNVSRIVPSLSSK